MNDALKPIRATLDALIAEYRAISPVAPGDLTQHWAAGHILGDIARACPYTSPRCGTPPTGWCQGCPRGEWCSMRNEEER